MNLKINIVFFFNISDKFKPLFFSKNLEKVANRIEQWFSNFGASWSFFRDSQTPVGPLLSILSQKTNEDQKKGHHWETVSDFFIFVPKD